MFVATGRVMLFCCSVDVVTPLFISNPLFTEVYSRVRGESPAAQRTHQERRARLCGVAGGSAHGAQDKLQTNR
jgi:hypothetical protein